jgi:hypothetical protein
MFSIREVAAIKEHKRNVKKETFNIILKKMTMRIKEYVHKGVDSAFVDIPPLVIGYPPYDMDFATRYLARQLVKLGFTVSIPHPGKLYVSWKIVPPPTKTKQKPDVYDEDDLSALMVIKTTASKLRGKN